MKITRASTVAALTLAALATGARLTSGGDQPATTIPFPADYRAWAHVKTSVVGPQSAFAASQLGMHHIYANAPALEGYRTGRLPDGSILVYDLLETVETSGNTIEGRQRRVDMMVKNGERYRATGGWGFTRFDPAEGRAGELRPTCFGCHSKQADHDFVFSRFREVSAPPSAAPVTASPAPAAAHAPSRRR